MFCSTCGNQIEDGAKFCSKCGTPVAPVEQPAETPVEQPAETPVEQPVQATVETPAETQFTSVDQPAPAEPVASPMMEQQVDMATAQDAAQQPQQAYGQAPQQEFVQPQMQPQAYGQAPQPVYNQAPAAAPKKSKAPLIIALVVLAVLILGGVGFGIYWINKPINKVNKAIEVKDYREVSTLYSELKAEEMTQVQDQMLLVCKNLYDDYLAERVDYDTVMSTYTALEAGVLNDSSEYYEVRVKLNNLKDSRDAWADANSAFDKGDYEAALDLYNKVISADANYKAAQDKVAECEALIVPDVVGEWEITIEVANMVAEEMGMYEGLDNLSLPMTLVYSFDEDGTGLLYVDVDALEPKLRTFYEDIFDVIVEQELEGTGLSYADMDKLCKEYYGMSFKEYYMMSFDAADFMDEFADCTETLTYEIDGQTVVATLDNSFKSDTLEYVDGTLVLQETAGDIEIFEQFGCDLPLVFTRR